MNDGWVRYAPKIANFFPFCVAFHHALYRRLEQSFRENLVIESVLWHTVYLASELKPELLKQNLSVEESSPRKGSKKKSISSNSCQEAGFSPEIT